MSVRRIQWFPEHGSPGWYVLSVAGVPLAFVLAWLAPWRLPDGGYGVLIFLSALPVWGMVLSAANAHDKNAHGWFGLRAQVWLQLGGALPAALRAVRRPDAPFPWSLRPWIN